MIALGTRVRVKDVGKVEQSGRDGQLVEVDHADAGRLGVVIAEIEQDVDPDREDEAPERMVTVLMDAAPGKKKQARLTFFERHLELA